MTNDKFLMSNKMSNAKCQRHKIRNFLIWLAFFTGLPWLRMMFYRCLRIPLLRVIAFHEIKDNQTEKFEKILDFLSKRFNIISPDDFLQQRLDKERANLLLTFDDAYESWLKNVAPILKKRGWSAIFFLEGRGERLALVLAEQDFVIGGHTVSHCRLTEIPRDELVFEIGENKKQLEQAVGQRIIFFAYPFGDKQSFNQPAIDELKAAGYRYAFTILPGFNKQKTNNYLLHRDSIDVNWSQRFLTAWLSGCYDGWKRLLDVF